MFSLAKPGFFILWHVRLETGYERDALPKRMVELIEEIATCAGGEQAYCRK
jgi:hypothetical protein